MSKSSASDRGQAGSAPASEQQNTAGLFALEIMHEIRNPLEALGNLVYLANTEADDPGQVRSYMRMAEEQIATLNRITTQSLAFARGSQLPKQMCVRELTESALRIHHRAIATKNIHLVKFLPESIRVEVRAGQLLQVLSNLLRNAIDALPDEGTLCVRLRRKHEQVELLVADNGHGIAPQNLEHIFEPFFTTKSETGTGLGLSLSKKIVEEHGGTLRVRSTVRFNRHGTVFKVALPA